MALKSAGFTLIEVLIAVLIVAILVGIAYPSYQQYVTRAYRVEAHMQLSQIANLQEQYFLDNLSFTGDLTDLGLAANPLVSDSGRYQISATINNGRYSLKAVAQGNQATLDEGCGTLQLTMEGQKVPQECW